MRKKVINVALFLMVLASAIAMTVYVGKGAPGVMLYNFIFLGVMTAIYIAGLAGGMFRMNNIARAFEDASVEIQNLMQKPGKIHADKIQILNGIFHHKYLDRTMDSFTDCIIQSEEGIGDVEDYFNEEELDNHIHKRLLEMVPDIFTSLGILGTFVGLVWGLKNFEPTNYEVMTTSVSALVDGIKVAFLTSIYGIALSIVYTYGMKSEYSSMAEALQAFLARFHSHVMPSAENESRNLLLSSQKIQTAAMNQMAEQFSVQMADSFEKVITPTFKKMNDSLDTLVSSVTRCQEDAVREILNVFLKEMNDSFGVQFSEFGNTLAQLKEAQTDNVNYTTNLYQAMSRQLSDSYTQHEQAMKKIMEEAGSSQKEYMDIARKIVRDNQEIQKQQQADYHHLADYLKEAETSSAKFWVACNQTMQKYVEAAAQGMDKVSSAGRLSNEVLASNQRVVEEFQTKMQEFTEYQKKSYRTMEQVRRLLADVSAAGNNGEVRLSAGRTAQNESLEQLKEILSAQAEQQQEFMEEMSRNIRELSKTAQKGKFGIFR